MSRGEASFVGGRKQRPQLAFLTFYCQRIRAWSVRSLGNLLRSAVDPNSRGLCPVRLAACADG